jgi:hypothetical protein
MGVNSISGLRMLFKLIEFCKEWFPGFGCTAAGRSSFKVLSVSLLVCGDGGFTMVDDSLVEMELGDCG